MYIGRVDIRIFKEGDYLEVLNIKVSPNREHHYGEPIICEVDPEDMVGDILVGRTDGVHDISGRYYEEYHQDYYGEWDGDFHLEGEKVKYRGPLKEKL